MCICTPTNVFLDPPLVPVLKSSHSFFLYVVLVGFVCCDTVAHTHANKSMEITKHGSIDFVYIHSRVTFEDPDTERCGKLLSSLYQVDFDMLRYISAFLTNVLHLLLQHFMRVDFFLSVYHDTTDWTMGMYSEVGMAIGVVCKEKDYHFRCNSCICNVYQAIEVLEEQVQQVW